MVKVFSEVEHDRTDDERGSWRTRVDAINVTSLGPLAVVGPGGTLLPISGHPGRLLVELLTHPSGVDRADLTHALWPDSVPATAASALRVHLSALRRAVAPAGIEVTRGPSGDVVSGAVWDVDVLDRIVTDTRRLWSSGAASPDDLAAASEAIEAALDLWRGDALAPYDHEPSLVAAVQAIERRRAEAEELAVDLHLAQGALPSALRALESPRIDRTFDEGWWARRLLALYRSGRQRDALAEYERVRRLLADELGLEPGPLLRDMHQRVLDQDPALDWRPPGGATDARPTSLIGRRQELARLRAGLEDARRGGVAITVVSGEPGIGKSTLVHAFTDTLDPLALVLDGRAERTAAVPLRGVLSALEAHLGPAGGDEGVRAAEALRPTSYAEPNPEAIALLRHTVLTRLAELVVSLSADRSLVLVIDDAHWADPMTVAFLDQLATDHAEATVQVVLTVREAEFEGSQLAGLVSDLALTRPVHRIHVGPLAVDEIDELVEYDDPAALHQASGGNPLFALQLQRLWADSGRDAPLPDGLVALCATRVQRLAAPAREVLDGAAVAGLEFRGRDVANIVGAPPAQVDAVLRRLVEDQLVEPTGSDGHRFVHGIVRRCAYEGIDPVRRTGLHLAAARHLEGDPARLPELALHLAEARPLVPDEEVARASGAAATQLLSVGAGEQAAQYFHMALASLSPSDRRRANAYLGLGVGLRLESDDTGADEALLQAWLDAASTERWDVAADALIAQADFGPAASIPSALALIERIDRTLDGLGDRRDDRRELLLTQKAHQIVNIDLAEAARSIDVATELAGDPPGLHLEHARLRLGESRGDDPMTCARHAVDLSARAEVEGNLRLAAEAAVHAQAAYLRAGDLAACDHEAERGRLLAERTGLAIERCLAELMSVARVLASGSIDDADAASELATADPPPGLGDLLVTSRFMHLLTIRREQCRLRELEPVLVASLELNPRRLTRPLIATTRREDGDEAGAQAQLDIFVEELESVTQDWVYVATLAFAADAAVECGHVELAQRLRTRFDDVEPQVVVGCTGLIVGSHIDRHRGALAAVCGDLDLGIDLLSSARSFESSRGAELWWGWASHDEARARLQRRGPGDVAAADRLLTEAGRLARDQGSERLAVAVRGLAEVRRD